MSIELLAIVRGEFMQDATRPDDIMIMEHRAMAKKLLTKEPYLIISNAPQSKSVLNFTKWLDRWYVSIHHEYDGTVPTFNIKVLELSTLNETFDDVLIHKKYEENDFVELTGKLGLSCDRRLKVGNRILYNWFVTSINRLRMKHRSSDSYLYMEITAQIGTEET
ncbi:MAG: hypothetical protein NC548_38320 [Lachnospiraceae bacterium]|nr:hypothetical protein [Lachnospiraceae bacterium]